MSDKALIAQEVDGDRIISKSSNNSISDTKTNDTNAKAANQQETPLVQSYTGMPEYENPRATLRLSGIREDTQDFFFEPFDPSNPESSNLLRCLSRVTIIRVILTNYGFKAVAALSSVYFCVKGVASATTGLAYFPLLKKGFHVTDAARQQQLGYIAQMAWPMKPLIGLISDNFPIMGYRKRVYLVGFTGLAMISLFAIFVMPTEEGYSVQLVTLFLFCLNFCFAGADLLCESAYSRFMILKREGGTAIISWVWGLYLFAGIVAAVLVGPFADAGEPKVTMIVLVPFVFVAFIALALNWLGERKVIVNRTVKRRNILDDGAEDDFERGNNHIKKIDKNKDGNDEDDDDCDDDRVSYDDGDTRRDTLASDGGGRLALAGRGKTRSSGSAGAKNATGDSSADRLRGSRASAASRRSVVSQQAQDSSEIDAGVAGATSSHYRRYSNTILVEYDPSCVDKVLPCIFQETDSQKRWIAFFSIVMGICAPASAAVSLWTSDEGPEVGLFFVLAVLIVLSIFSFKCMPPIICKAMIFMCLKEATYIQTSGALNYFYTGSEECVPGGPQFSFTYFQTVSQIISGLAGTFGAFIFHRYLSKKTFRFVYILTTCLRVLASCFDVMLVTRSNIKIGIPDHVMYIFGDAMIYQCSYTLDFMPAVMLTANLCPHGLEATMYAVLAGFSNFGSIFSGTLGSVLSKYFNIKTKDGDCDFTNLAPLVILSHCILPLLAIPLTYYLVPNQIVSEKLKNDYDGGDESNSSSSSSSDDENNNRPSSSPSEHEIYGDEENNATSNNKKNVKDRDRFGGPAK